TSSSGSLARKNFCPKSTLFESAFSVCSRIADDWPSKVLAILLDAFRNPSNAALLWFKVCSANSRLHVKPTLADSIMRSVFCCANVDCSIIASVIGLFSGFLVRYRRSGPKSDRANRFLLSVSPAGHSSRPNVPIQLSAAGFVPSMLGRELFARDGDIPQH